MLHMAQVQGATVVNDSLIHEYSNYMDMSMARANQSNELQPLTDNYYHQANCFVDALSPSLVSTAIELNQEAPSICQGLFFIAFGGKIKEVAPNATAFPWRSSEFSIRADCVFEDEYEANVERSKEYLDRWFKVISPYCNGGSFLNFVSPLWAGDADLYQQMYYGENLQRLQRVKAAWVPPENTVLQFPMEIRTK